MFSNHMNHNNTNVTTLIANNLNEVVVHKGICSSSNSILASATASISSHSQTNRCSPVNQHRISIQVKVENKSDSSAEDNSNGEHNEPDVSAGGNIGQQRPVANNWSNCIYGCNISDANRFYSEDKCLEPLIETKSPENGTNPLNALKDQLNECLSLSSMNASRSFTVNTAQNNQLYLTDNLGSHCMPKANSMRDERVVLSNAIPSNPLQESVVTQEDKRHVLSSDPNYWTREHVRQWLEWMAKDYSLHNLDMNRFDHILGKELCQMRPQDFKNLTDCQTGDFLFNVFQTYRQNSMSLCKEKQIANEIPVHRDRERINTLTPLTPSYQNKSYSQNMIHNSGNSVRNYRQRNVFKSENSDQHLATSSLISDTLYNPTKNFSTTMLFTDSSYKGAWGSPSPSPGQGYPHNAITGMTKPLDVPHSHSHLRNIQDPYTMFGPTSQRLASQGSGQIQLWQFLLELLSDSGNANCITWEGTNGEFKLSDPDEVARRWGERKSKPNMNYDKLSRALRYYYDKNIMTKVHGKRYAYKFDFQGLAQATQPTAADPSAYKAAYQSADLFMHPHPGYHHSSSAAKLNFAAAVHSAGMSSSTPGSIFPSATSYWSSPGAAANLYSNIAAASATHHASMPHHHHPSHVSPHIGSYAHYA